MLTKMKKIFLLVIFAAFTLVLAGCSDASKMKSALKDFNSSFEDEITDSFTLPTADATLEGSVTSWMSGNEDVIKVDGTYAEVTRPGAKNVDVVLTATITLGEATESRDFTVTVKKLDAPTEIAIEPVLKGGKFVKDEANEGHYKLVKGFEGQLNIVVPDETMSTEVNWIVGNKKVCKIDENGKITGLTFGKTSVRAQSTSGVGADGQGILAQIEINVVEDLNPRVVLLNAKHAIEEEMPKFVYESFELPATYNKYVKVKYFDKDNREIANRKYNYKFTDEDSDRVETLKAIISYEGEEEQFDLTIRVVKNPENNEFLALEYAKAQIDQIFAKYVGKGKVNLTGNLELPENFTEEEAKFPIEVSYEQETDYMPRPLKFGEFTEGEKTAYGIRYTKPNDTCDSRIIVYMKAANNDAVVRYTVTVQGYIQSEIIEYLNTNKVLPQKNDEGKYETIANHIPLATKDTTGKFDRLEIEWKSSDETVITNEGRFANVDLAEEKNVKLTAVLKYTYPTAEWAEKMEFDYIVKPAANDAQKVTLKLGDYFNKPEFLDNIEHFPFGDLSRSEDKTQVNVIPLPNTIGDLKLEEFAKYKDVQIKWSSAEDGLLDENHKLLKQYLRYHEVNLIYSITIDGQTATSEFPINVGIAETKNTYYIGGLFALNQSGDEPHKGDALSQLSKFDDSVGKQTLGTRTWGFIYKGKAAGHGEFGGYTFYVDGKDPETKKPMRYQWYLPMKFILTLTDNYNMDLKTGKYTGLDYVPASEDGKTPAQNEINQYGSWNSNWGNFIINTSSKDQYVPMSPLEGRDSQVIGADEKPVQWKANSQYGRENAFSIDGYRTGFVTDKNGKVILGNGAGYLQDILGDPKKNTITPEDYFIKIPAGGFAMTFRTQINNPLINGRFCEKGARLHLQYFEPYTLSADGSTEGLYTYAH